MSAYRGGSGHSPGEWETRGKQSCEGACDFDERCAVVALVAFVCAGCSVGLRVYFDDDESALFEEMREGAGCWSVGSSGESPAVVIDGVVCEGRHWVSDIVSPYSSDTITKAPCFGAIARQSSYTDL
jgi:hypothetical protein